MLSFISVLFGKTSFNSSVFTRIFSFAIVSIFGSGISACTILPLHGTRFSNSSLYFVLTPFISSLYLRKGSK
jgi:hypothetical protein